MEFNAKKETNKIIEFIKKYYKENKLKGVIIGISGGKDSAVASALFTKALGKENVIGLTLPCHSQKQDIQDAKTISKHFSFKLYNFDLTNTYNEFKKELNNIDSFSNEETQNKKY